MGHYLAIDLGAESGRAIAGTLRAGHLTVDELHRFPNTPVREGEALFWDTKQLWKEIEKGISIASKDRKLALDGVGVDTWGVDIALLGANGALIERPRHYRDPRNHAAMEKLFLVVPPEEVFAYTGIQHMQINSLVQLYAMKLSKDPALDSATRLLNIPDLFNYWLTGVARSETTIASTTEFFSPSEMAWATELLKRLDLPARDSVSAGAARNTAGKDARGSACPGLCNRRPRYSGGGGCGAGPAPRALVLYQLGDVVAAGPGAGPAHHEQAGAGAECHQRGRGGA